MRGITQHLPGGSRWLAFLTLLIAALILPVRPHADIIRWTDDSEPTEVMVQGFMSGITGERMFLASPVNDGQVAGRFTELAAGAIRAIEFREIGHREGEPRGRLAHLRNNEGEMHHHIVVESARQAADGWTFQMRRAGVPFGGRTYQVHESRIDDLMFAPAAPETMPRGFTEGGLNHTRRQGALPRLTNIPEATPQEPRPQDRPPRDEEMDADQFVDQLFGITAVYGERSPYRKEEEKEGIARFFDISGATSGDQIMAVGFAMMFAGLGVMMGITFIVGTFVLMFSARNEGVGDLTLPRAMITSALLATVPPGLFVLCMLIPIPICAIKGIAGALAWWFSAKMIVAGMLEVMEGKAFDILISFYAILILLMMGLWIYAMYGM